MNVALTAAERMAAISRGAAAATSGTVTVDTTSRVIMITEDVFPHLAKTGHKPRDIAVCELGWPFTQQFGFAYEQEQDYVSYDPLVTPGLWIVRGDPVKLDDAVAKSWMFPYRIKVAGLIGNVACGAATYMLFVGAARGLGSWRRRRRLRVGHCVECGYPVVGPRCPECGREVTSGSSVHLGGGSPGN